MRAAHTRVIDIKPGNRVKSVTRLANGDLQVTQHSGHTFTLSQDDEEFQSFVIYTVLAEC